MKVSLKNRLIISGTFIITAILLEIFTFTMLSIDILPTYFWMDFGLIIFVAGLINIFPKEKAMVVTTMIILLLQTVLSYLNITMFDIYGDLFSLQFISLTKEARAAMEINFVNFGKLFVIFFTYIIGIFFVAGYIRTFRATETVTKKKAWVTSLSSALVFCLVGLASFNIQVYSLSDDKDDKYYYLRSAAYLYDTLNIKSESFKHFGSYVYYMKEFRNVYLTGSKASTSLVEEIQDYLNSEHDDISTDYEGLLENQNVIMIMLESVQPFAISELFTPNIYRLLSEGIYFDKAVSRNKTNLSEFIGMNGSYPLMKALSPGSTDYDFSSWSIVDLLPDNYVTTYAHNNLRSYYNRGDLIPQVGFDNTYLFEDIYPGEDIYDWGDWIMDSEFMEEVIDYLIPDNAVAQNRPFYSWWTTLSTHGPYGESASTAKKLAPYYAIINAAKLNGLWVNPLKGQEDEKAYEAYIAVAMDLDAAIGMMIDKLERLNILDETVFVLYGDHNCYYYNLYKDVYKVEDGDFDNAQMYVEPMILYSQKLTAQYKVNNGIDTNQSAVDHSYVSPYNIVPTLLDLLGLDYNPNLYVATSMLYDGADYNEKNVFISMQGGIFTYDIFTQNGIDPLQTIITDEEEFNEKLEDISVAANYFFYKMSYIDKIYTYNLMKKLNN